MNALPTKEKDGGRSLLAGVSTVPPASRDRFVAGSVVCFFFPARLTVFVNAVFTLIFGIILLYGRQSLHLHWFGGGYTHATSTLLGLADFLGIILGGFGVSAAWKNRGNYHFAFLLYGFYRTVNLAACFVLDYTMITTCELWLSDIKGQTETHGFSHTMFRMAFEGHCADERRDYFLTSYSLFFLYGYLFYVSWKYHRELAERPKYLFSKPPDDLAYYTTEGGAAQV
ncbi:unnamed protein product [Amoebophrya sp. A25]|nr:unnamed protein product [Amoebophrya sp. A25]|eukprot:GSA25T00020521001.1